MCLRGVRVAGRDRPARLRQDLDRKPLVDGEGGERDENRLQPPVRDEHAVHGAAEHPEEEYEHRPQSHRDEASACAWRLERVRDVDHTPRERSILVTTTMLWPTATSTVGTAVFTIDVH